MYHDRCAQQSRTLIAQGLSNCAPVIRKPEPSASIANTSHISVAQQAQ